jgi:hypothetical protein
MLTDGAQVLWRVVVTEQMSTGRTQHSRAGADVTASIRELRIARYEDAGEDGGFYLFCLSGDGKVVSDTNWPTIEEAFDQAEFEFGVARARWVVATDS